jgi:7,8-dihydro-6-hydroxymethylpterin dimethyltransferase
LQTVNHTLVLRAEDVQHAKQTDLDKLGIAKTAREEKIRARDHKLHEKQENERMAKLYRQHVLKEAPGPELVQLAPIAPAPKAATESREEVGSFGD